jgi:hypothetical protein
LLYCGGLAGSSASSALSFASGPLAQVLGIDMQKIEGVEDQPTRPEPQRQLQCFEI